MQGTARKFEVAAGKYRVGKSTGFNWPRIWSYSGHNNKPSTFMKEEMEFIEQLNNSQIFKECLEP